MFRLGVTELIIIFGLCVVLIALPIALALVVGRRAAVKTGRVPCPYCAELIQPAAKTCRFCGRNLPPDGNP